MVVGVNSAGAVTVPISKRMTDVELCAAVDAANRAFDLRYDEGVDTAAEWKRICRIYREIERRMAEAAMSDISRCAMLTEALRSLINGRRSPGSRGKDEWFYTLIDATMGIIEVYRANPATLPPHMILPHLRFAKQTFPRLDHITLPSTCRDGIASRLSIPSQMASQFQVISPSRIGIPFRDGFGRI